MLGNPLTLRLRLEKHAQYEDEAGRLGKPLGTYLRERLEAADETRDELLEIRKQLATLRHLIEDLADGGPREREGPGTNPVQIETLLLLRAIAGPERMKPVMGEMKRLELQTWTPEEAQVG